MTSRGRVVLTIVISVLAVLVLEIAMVLIVVYSGSYNVAASRPHTGLAHFVKQLPELSPAQYQDLAAQAGHQEQPGGAAPSENTEHQH